MAARSYFKNCGGGEVILRKIFGRSSSFENAVVDRLSLADEGSEAGSMVTDSVDSLEAALERLLEEGELVSVRASVAREVILPR
jgi:hypothetical protein